jgi:integral membrane sensor domain MASE1
MSVSGVTSPPTGFLSRGQLLTAIAALAALYFVSGILGLQLAHVQRNTTLIWAPTGISLAALVIFGIRIWPGILIGAFAVGTYAETPPVVAAVIAAGK